MIYTKQESDGYTKVAAGACQLQCSGVGVILGVIHTDTAPEATDAYEFSLTSGKIHTTLGRADCYVKVLSKTPTKFSATEI